MPPTWTTVVAMLRRCVCVALLPVLALVASGCGSSSAAAKSTSAGTIPAGAAQVSAKVQLFATVDSSFGDQWVAFTKLVDRFPIRGEAIDSIQKDLSDSGIDFEKDIKARGGPGVDAPGGTPGNPDPHAVGLPHPKKRPGLGAALKRGPAPPATAEDGD